LQQDAVNEQVQFAFDAGINFIDTANVYSLGKSEMLLGQSRHHMLAQQRQVSVAQIALAWLLAKPFVSSVIIGARSMEQLRDNVAATRVRMSSKCWTK
jgi:aryl-alcohol dehydrogenase-like predicted oxidoreductase